MPDVEFVNLGLANDKIVSVQRTSGTGSPGTTDTYTITLRSGDTYNFNVTNGANGASSLKYKIITGNSMLGNQNAISMAVENEFGESAADIAQKTVSVYYRGTYSGRLSGTANMYVDASNPDPILQFYIVNGTSNKQINSLLDSSQYLLIFYYEETTAPALDTELDETSHNAVENMAIVSGLRNGYVPKTRRVAGINLVDDITKTELQSALDVDKVWESSTNVYNKETDTQNKLINASGALQDDNNFSTSDFIEIPFNGDNYIYINASNVAVNYNDYKGIYWYALYDENKTFINRSAMIAARISGFSNLSNQAKYIRIVVAKNTNDLMVTFKATYDTAYDPDYVPYGGKMAEPLKETIEDIANTTYDTITENKENAPLKHLIYNGGMMSIFRKIGVVGDSLSSGCMETHDNLGIDMYDYSWIQTIGKICGSTAFNFSAGGLTSKNFWTTNNAYVKHLRDKDNDYKCTGYFIALGVNDIADTSLNVGTSTDINDDTKDTFYAYYSRIISLIKEVQPKAKIFLVGLPNHPAMTVWGSRFTQFKNAIADMVNYFDNCYYLDLFTYDVLYDDDFRTIYFNGFHENALGYLRSAWVISSYCDWIIRHNYEEFREVAFIGTNYYYYE